MDAPTSRDLGIEMFDGREASTQAVMVFEGRTAVGGSLVGSWDYARFLGGWCVVFESPDRDGTGL